MPRKTNLDMGQVFFVIIVASLIIGTILGSVSANILDEESYAILAGYIVQYVNTVGDSPHDSATLFFYSFVRHGIVAIFIWILICGKLAMTAALFVLLIRGVGFGFTTSFLVREFGMEGVYTAITLYFFQNILLVPIYMWLMYNNMAFVASETKKGKSEWLEYGFVLIIGIAVVVLACLVEVFIIL